MRLSLFILILSVFLVSTSCTVEPNNQNAPRVSATPAPSRIVSFVPTGASGVEVSGGAARSLPIDAIMSAGAFHLFALARPMVAPGVIVPTIVAVRCLSVNRLPAASISNIAATRSAIARSGVLRPVPEWTHVIARTRVAGVIALILLLYASAAMPINTAARQQAAAANLVVLGFMLPAISIYFIFGRRSRVSEAA